MKGISGMAGDETSARLLDEAGSVLLDRLQLARSLPQRMRGLLGRDELAANEGLLLDPCRSIHMFGMRFPIDAVFLDSDMRVLKIFPALQPGKLAQGPHGTCSVLEIPAGSAAELNILPGHLLRIG
jgi:uncharacterized protein